MSEHVTKDDLRQFSLIIVNELKKEKPADFNPDWLKGRIVKETLSIPSASLQSLRITEKVRCRKILGSYYYDKSDLNQLYDD